MKKIYTILAALTLIASAYGQAPLKMSYQAVVRDANNSLVKNQVIGMQISILQGSITGVPVCIETHTPTSNDNGLVSLEIGGGILIAGDFITIDWANGPYFIKTETDPDGGTNYTISGTSQLMSVPFALHAKTAEYIWGGEIDPVFGASVAQGINAGDTVNWNKPTVEFDPIFGYSVAHGITPLDTFIWNHHTINTDTHLDSTGIANLGYAAGMHTIKYTDAEAVSAVGTHTIDTDTHIDSVGVDALGFTSGSHTIDTDTHLDSMGIANHGYVAGSHTVKYTDAEAVTAVGTHTIDTDTHLDAMGIANHGYVAGSHTIKYTDAEAVTAVGSHTVDTDTHLDAAGVAALGFTSGSHTVKYTDAEAVTAVGSHTVDTDTHLNATGVAALGFTSGAHTVKYTDAEAVTAVGLHTVDTDTHLDAAGVAALGFTSGAHTVKYTDAEAVSAVGSHTVDTDTQLSESQVDAFVSNNGYLTSEVDGSTTNEIELPTGGSNGQVLKTDGSGNYAWVNQSSGFGTPLTEGEVDAFVANNGFLTSEVDGSTTNEIELPTSGNSGDMNYWNGSAWVTIPTTPNEGATLQMIGGVPTWTGGTPPPLSIGDFRDGGIVFWLDGSGGGLVCAVSDQNLSHRWYNSLYLTTGATATAIGAGQSNTVAIVSNQGVGSYAAQLCNDLVLNSYSDWFLPSKDELNEMYLKKVAINVAAIANGGASFSSSVAYWSSSEFNLNNAFVIFLKDGTWSNNAKNQRYNVRAVRVF